MDNIEIYRGRYSQELKELKADTTQSVVTLSGIVLGGMVLIEVLPYIMK